MLGVTTPRLILIAASLLPSFSALQFLVRRYSVLSACGTLHLFCTLGGRGEEEY